MIRISILLSLVAACGEKDAGPNRKDELDRAVAQATKSRLKEVTGSEEAPPEGCDDPLPASMGSFELKLEARARSTASVNWASQTTSRARFVAGNGGKIEWREAKYEDARGWLQMLFFTNEHPFSGKIVTGMFELQPNTAKSRGIHVIVTSVGSSSSGGTAFEAVSGTVTIDSIDEKVLVGSLSNVVLRATDRYHSENYIDAKCSTRIEHAKLRIERTSL